MGGWWEQWMGEGGGLQLSVMDASGLEPAAAAAAAAHTLQVQGVRSTEPEAEVVTVQVYCRSKQQQQLQYRLCLWRCSVGQLVVWETTAAP